MAAVSAEMYRPGRPHDPPIYDTQRVYDSAELSKPKKWSSKLKLSTSGSSKSSEKSPESPYMYGTISSTGSSALSKSMKYAETWLYGTMRAPATASMRPSIFSAYPDVPGRMIVTSPQKPTAANYAVILCSCPEYLNGTKKNNSTKVSICKKCKGSRLPITISEPPRILVGGTLRGHQVVRDVGNLRAGTLKVQNLKSRPSILKSRNLDSTDPYDLMRRSRLAPPHEACVGSQFSTIRTRAKSISPTRNNSRHLSPSPDLSKKSRSKSVTRLKDLWIDETIEYKTDQKRSILACDVNPYELVNSENGSLVEIEFDDDFENRFSETFIRTERRNRVPAKTNSSIKAIGGQRIRITEDISDNAVDSISVYDSKGVKNDIKKFQLRTQELSASLIQPQKENKKNLTNKQIPRKNNISGTGPRGKLKNFSPKRPPRKLRNSKTDDDSESDNQSKKPFKKWLQNNELSKSSRQKQGHPGKIKSILKKPKTHNDFDKIEDESVYFSDDKTEKSSHFYLPKPNISQSIKSSKPPILQRKRVQFLVEDTDTKIIYTAEFDLAETLSKSSISHNINESTNIGQICIENSNECEKLLASTFSNVVLNEYEDVFDSTRENRIETSDIETNKNKDMKKDESNSESQKLNVLRRSESERLPPNVLVTPPKFLDTMALRPKVQKIHTSQVFLSPQDTNIVDLKNFATLTLQPEQKRITNMETPCQNINLDPEAGNLSDSSDITEQILKNLRQSISPERPPRLKSKDQRYKNRKNNYVKTRFVRSSSLSSTSDEWSDANDSEQKTVLRVEEPTSLQQKSENEKKIIGDDDSRRTSIQITAEDCYSSMNALNETPIYLSSVVVNDDYSSTYQGGTTVTISITSPEDGNVTTKSEIYIENSINQKKISDTNTYEDYGSPNTENQNESKKIANENSNKPGVLIEDTLDSIVCKNDAEYTQKFTENGENDISSDLNSSCVEIRNGFVAKLFDDPQFGHLAEGLDSGLVSKLIENSLIKLQESKNMINQSSESVNQAIEKSFVNLNFNANPEQDSPRHMSFLDIQSSKLLNSDEVSNTLNEENGCSAPYESMEYENGALGVFSDLDPLSDCYNASTSELSTEDDTNSTRSKFYQMLVDSSMCEIDVSNNNEEDHLYESIRMGCDPIYEEISDMPPPLPSNPPPTSLLMSDDERKSGSRSIFEGASKYDILSYLVDAKERGIDTEENYITRYELDNEMNQQTPKVIEEISKKLEEKLLSNNLPLSNGSDSSENSSLVISSDIEKAAVCKKTSAEIERNDSGVGSETSKTSRSRWQGRTSPSNNLINKDSPIHLCEDCDTAVETQITETGAMYAPLVCRKCAKKRTERKEIITEIVETEEKYGKDLQIILEEFYKPMLVAGLLTQEQLSAIFLNVEELLENNQVLSEKLRDGLEIAVEQGDEDLLTVNVGKIILECASMLSAFQTYCVRQAGAALLLAGLEKEKELLRIFLRVSQMENAVLRRMNLNSFLMVPVQRVTKYPLLLSRLYRASAACAADREDIRAAQRCVEERLEEMNTAAAAAAAAARDVPLWRRLAAARRTATDLHVADIRLRKMAVDVLDWNHDDARFAMEGKLLFTQPNDNNWRKGRTIKLTPVNALLVTNGKAICAPTTAKESEGEDERCGAREGREGRGGRVVFARRCVREAALLLVREKAGRYTLHREPLFLDRCVVAADHEPDHFFEVHEIITKDSYIFKAEEHSRTRSWYKQLQLHAQGAGTWRKRRNALANIMINPMLTRN